MLHRAVQNDPDEEMKLDELIIIVLLKVWGISHCWETKT